MSIKKDFGKRLKEIRTKKGITQSMLAEIVDIDAKHMSHIETGRCFPKADLIEKFARALEVDYYLFFDMPADVCREKMIAYINKILSQAENADLVKIYRFLLHSFV